MKKTHNLVVVNGTYKDSQRQEKKRYLTIGSAFTGDDGQISLKIESIPVGGEWNGWVNLYLPRDQQDRPTPAQAPADPAREPGSDDGAPFNDPIPFGD